jgi:hypothetical protein
VLSGLAAVTVIAGWSLDRAKIVLGKKLDRTRADLDEVPDVVHTRSCQNGEGAGGSSQPTGSRCSFPAATWLERV